MVPLPDGKILISGGYSKQTVKKDVDKGIVHTDTFTLVPDSKLIYDNYEIIPCIGQPVPRIMYGKPAFNCYLLTSEFQLEAKLKNI